MTSVADGTRRQVVYYAHDRRKVNVVRYQAFVAVDVAVAYVVNSALAAVMASCWTLNFRVGGCLSIETV